MKPVLLLLIPMSGDSLKQLDAEYEVLAAPNEALRAEAVPAQGSRVQVVLTNGTTGLRADEIDAMPQLQLVSCLGVGYENVAVAHAWARGIVLSNGAGTNDDCVADHALALLLATVRAVPQFDKACRDGVWRDALPMRPQLAGKRMGLLGLGSIGRKIARRAVGFDMVVGYHTRTARDDAGLSYFSSLLALAEWSDVLVVAIPGGPETRHLVNAAVLKALGPQGFLVNIARGSIVDTEALATALRSGELAGAGLDVYESEPKPPALLMDLPNVVLTPHVAGTSPEAKEATLRCFIDNAGLYFSGQPVRNPI